MADSVNPPGISGDIVGRLVNMTKRGAGQFGGCGFFRQDGLRPLLFLRFQIHGRAQCLACGAILGMRRTTSARSEGTVPVMRHSDAGKTWNMSGAMQPLAVHNKSLFFRLLELETVTAEPTRTFLGMIPKLNDDMGSVNGP